jgi:hypothetical protein
MLPSSHPCLLNKELTSGSAPVSLTPAPLVRLPSIHSTLPPTLRYPTHYSSASSLLPPPLLDTHPTSLPPSSSSPGYPFSSPLVTSLTSSHPTATRPLRLTTSLTHCSHPLLPPSLLTPTPASTALSPPPPPLPNTLTLRELLPPLDPSQPASSLLGTPQQGRSTSLNAPLLTHSSLSHLLPSSHSRPVSLYDSKARSLPPPPTTLGFPLHRSPASPHPRPLHQPPPHRSPHLSSPLC